MREIALFSVKIYTACTNFTRPLVVTVATNLNSVHFIFEKSMTSLLDRTANDMVSPTQAVTTCSLEKKQRLDRQDWEKILQYVIQLRYPSIYDVLETLSKLIQVLKA